MVDQKKLNKVGSGLIFLAIVLPFLGWITPIDVTILNNISYGLIVIALILFGKKFWKWYGKEEYTGKSEDQF